jgi:Domain of unknown function (DUF3786)
MPPRFQAQRDKLAAQAPQKWLNNLTPKVTHLRAELARRDPHDLSERSGATFDATQQTIQFELWGKPYTLVHPELVARDASGAEASTYKQALLLMYLQTADGTPPAGKWLAYRELPGGMFYANAFHGYAELRLAQSFNGDLAKFRAAAVGLKGSKLTFGDASFEFVALPRILVAAVYWLGDEDFPSNASILFDAAASHYLPTDAVGALGSQLVSRLVGTSDEDAQTLTALAVQPPDS